MSLRVTFGLCLFLGGSCLLAEHSAAQKQTSPKVLKRPAQKQTKKPIIPTKSEQAKALIAKANRLSKSVRRSVKYLATKLYLKAYKLTPKQFDAILGASKACFIRSDISKTKKMSSYWAQRGWLIAKKLIKGWPRRAEGYYFSSICIGRYASGAGVWKALTRGLAGKIKKMAKASLKRNRGLYQGAAQRILGRYYYRLPWPMRNLKKSRAYLEESYKMAPNHAHGLYFLADTLWKMGKKKRARSLYLRCARKKKMSRPVIKCKQWLLKNSK